MITSLFAITPNTAGLFHLCVDDLQKANTDLENKFVIFQNLAAAFTHDTFNPAAALTEDEREQVAQWYTKETVFEYSEYLSESHVGWTL